MESRFELVHVHKRSSRWNADITLRVSELIEKHYWVDLDIESRPSFFRNVKTEDRALLSSAESPLQPAYTSALRVILEACDNDCSALRGPMDLKSARPGWEAAVKLPEATSVVSKN